MAKHLNDTQRLILSAAAARDDLRALPLPEALRAPAHTVKKAVAAMIEQGLLDEITALPEDTPWTESEAGGRVALVATPVGLAVIGIEPDTSPTEGQGAAEGSAGASTPGKRSKGLARASVGEGEGKQSKQDTVLALLRRPEGASVHEMAAATSWQPHSVRGFLSGALKKRLKLEVTSEKEEGGERRYFVAPLKPAAD
ncbi:MAG: DUF3489 domain-containing protein [Dehalococcoidia bacterium]